MKGRRVEVGGEEKERNGRGGKTSINIIHSAYINSE